VGGLAKMSASVTTVLPCAVQTHKRTEQGRA
jgi:hypothetical protein